MICQAETFFFCHLQLRSFLKSVLGSEMTLPMLSDLGDCFMRVKQLVLSHRCILS